MPVRCRGHCGCGARLSPRVAITAAPGFEPQAQELAQKLNLEITGINDLSYLFKLQFIDDKLQFIYTRDKPSGPIFVDFVHGKAAYRRHQGKGRNTPLARAVGFKPGVTPGVIDATAGLGQDAFVLATLGARITLVEKSPVIHALLEDGLRRAAFSPHTRDIARRMSLVQADAREFLQQLSAENRPDAVYLDPMYPHRGKSALSKKEMQSFQKLLGADQDGPQLLQIARTCTHGRVAVKRPLKAPFLGAQAPNFQILRPKIRFDVYLGEALQKS